MRPPGLARNRPACWRYPGSGRCGRGGIDRLEVPFDGDAEAQAALLAGMVEAGHRVSGFSHATSDLEEIFLKVTGQQDDQEAAA